MIHYSKVGDNITVILTEKPDADGRPTVLHINQRNFDEHIPTLLDTLSEDEIEVRFATPEVREAITTEVGLRKIISNLGEMDGIIEKDNSYYLESIPSLSIPETLLKAMSEAIETGDDQYYRSLVLLWMRCAINENPEARVDLFKFLRDGGYILTSKGNFLSFRNVEDHFLFYNGKIYPRIFTFMQEGLDDAVARWKRSPKDLYIHADPTFENDYVGGYTYRLSKSNKSKGYEHCVGNLKEVAEFARKNNTFTDAHSKTFHIRIGELVSQSRDKCDYNAKKDCSQGLHVGNQKFLTKNYYGNVGIMVLVNPTDVVAVPEYNHNKLRTSKYFPVGYAEYDSNGRIILPDLKVLEHEFETQSIAEVEERMESMSFTEFERTQIIPTDIEFGVFRKTEADIHKLSAKLENRVIDLSQPAQKLLP